MITLELLRESTTLIPEQKDYDLEGVWIVSPRLKVVALEDGLYIRKGRVYTATHFDESGKHPATFHLLEAGLWWRIDLFDKA